MSSKIHAYARKIAAVKRLLTDFPEAVSSRRCARDDCRDSRAAAGLGGIAYLSVRCIAGGVPVSENVQIRASSSKSNKSMPIKLSGLKDAKLPTLWLVE